MNFNFIIYLILILFFLFSIYAENKYCYDAFSEGELTKNDNTKEKRKNNIKICAYYFQNTVRWRRCYMTTFLSIIIIFLIIGKIPTLREITFSIIFVFIMTVSIWEHFSKYVANKSFKLLNKNLNKI